MNTQHRSSPSALLLGSATLPLSRRRFLRTAAAATGAMTLPSFSIRARGESPSNKLNIACVGVGGMQGVSDVNNIARDHNVYALCDVDENFLATAAERFPQAKTYRDFREMLDKEYKNLDGITITTPDHMHASIALRAMERGLAVYCQKPLTHTVWESRMLAKAAAKYKVATQMGNQGYSSQGTRIACELLWEGRIGDVTEVHAWRGGGFSRGVTEWPAEQPIPETLDWDLWLGRAANRPFCPKIHPSQWRGFLDFGSQMVGDWGVHIMGPANWGLQLGSPSSVTCLWADGVNPVTYPHYSCVFEFPERPNPHVEAGVMPPVKIFWHEGSAEARARMPEGLSSEDLKSYNQIFYGTKGLMGTGGRGESVRLLPESAMQDFRPPTPVITRSPGHFRDWFNAIKDKSRACSDFSVAGPFTEWLLLATICCRFPEEKLEWDGANMRFTNNEKANAYLRPHCRKGWEMAET